MAGLTNGLCLLSGEGEGVEQYMYSTCTCTNLALFLCGTVISRERESTNAHNIMVTSVFTSSSHSFTPLWICLPLQDKETRNSIIENKTGGEGQTWIFFSPDRTKVHNQTKNGNIQCTKAKTKVNFLAHKIIAFQNQFVYKK